MSNVKKLGTVVFVTYQIKPINVAFEDSLWQHLFDKVWSEWSDPEEHISIISSKTSADFVRYQFGSTYEADEKCDEIGELIEEEINNWAYKFPDSVNVWV